MKLTQYSNEALLKNHIGMEKKREKNLIFLTHKYKINLFQLTKM